MQAILHLLIRTFQRIRYLDRLQFIIFQYFVDGIKRQFIRIVQSRLPLPDEGSGHLQHGLLEFFLIYVVSLPELFVKPSHAIFLSS